MALADLTFMGPEPYEPRERLAHFLRGALNGEHQAKRLARQIDCTPKTAENILNGHWPNSRHWAAIARSFGREVIDAVFAPEIDETVARLEEEVRALENQLQEARERRRKVEGARPHLSSGLPATEDRPAAQLSGRRPTETRAFRGAD